MTNKPQMKDASELSLDKPLRKSIFAFNIKLSKANKKGCINWLGSKNKKGYGKLSYNGKLILSHRFSYLIYYGYLDDNLFVCHRCDNPSCVNPKHLFLGTPKDNMKDASVKGRCVLPNQKGQNHPHSKLTDKKVKEIKKLMKSGASGLKVAKKYNVDNSVIYDIKNGRSWKHIK